MKREIKFRAWDRDYKKMTYQSPTVSAAKILDRYDTVMQFTGLYDKNGKAIYEGDLLKHKFYSGPVIVSFENGCFISEDVDILSSSIEVIGNIHENPELYKE